MALAWVSPYGSLAMILATSTVTLTQPAGGASKVYHKVFCALSNSGTLQMAGAIIEHRRKRTGAMATPYAESGGFWSVMPDAPCPDIQWHFVPAVLEDHGRDRRKRFVPVRKYDDEIHHASICDEDEKNSRSFVYKNSIGDGLGGYTQDYHRLLES